MDSDIPDHIADHPDAASEDPRLTPDLRPLVVALAAFGLAYYYALTRLVRGDLLNSYSFISPDGIEWLVGGFAVARWFDGIAIPELPVARNVGFVGVTSLDYLLGANGYFLFAVIAVAVAGALAVLLLMAWWGRIPRYQAAVVVLVFAVSPLGFSRMWLLSDQVATALMVLGAAALHPYATRGSRRWLVVAVASAGVGGATQPYALVGFVVAGGWCLAVSIWRRKPDYLLAGAVVLAPAITFTLQGLWFWLVPHGETLVYTRLVEFNFNMLGFYANVWGFAFVALVPLLGVLAVYRWRQVLASPVLAGYWLAVLAFMASTFFYQFEDFRFTVPTSLMMGLSIMATLPGSRPLPRARALMASTAVLALIVGLLLAPKNFVNPEWSTVKLDPSETFAGRLITAEPKDRFRLELHCQSDRLCAGVPFRVLDSDHNNTWFKIYRFLLSADSSTPVELFNEGIYEGVFQQRNTNDPGNPDNSVLHGLPLDRPLVGDWDGLGGTDTPGVFRGGLWVLGASNSEIVSGPPIEFEFGTAADVPVTGDWDGDGIDTVGVFTGGAWALRNSNSAGPADWQFEFGESGDMPVAGDWNGDGRDSIGVFREGRWLLRNTITSGTPDLQFDFGGPSDRPVAGDWDGDGFDTVGVFTDGVWKLRNTNTGDPADLEFEFGAFAALPVTGDWDNSGIDTVGIAR